jgi:hypothetical protein
VPVLRAPRLTCLVTDLFRLQSSRDLNYLIFLVTVAFNPNHFMVKTVGTGKKTKVLLQCELPVQQHVSFLERYLMLVYPYYYVEPIRTQKFSNAQVSLNFKGFRFPESLFFKPGDYLAENFYDFSVFFQYALTMTPMRQKTLYEQKFLMRAMNFPFANK